MSRHLASRVLFVLLLLFVTGAAAPPAAEAANLTATLVAVDVAGSDIAVRDGDRMVVNFHVTRRAVITRNGERVDLEDLVLGDQVRLNFDSARNLVRRIEASGDDTGDALEARVVSVDLADGTLIVRAGRGRLRTIVVDASTRISRNGEIATLEDLNRNDEVIIVLVEGTNQAASIVAAGRGGIKEIEGTISALTDTHVTIETANGKQHRFVINVNTMVSTADGHLGSPDDLEVGQLVEVDFVKRGRHAVRIEIEDEDEVEDEASGVVTEVGVADGMLTVDLDGAGEHTFHVVAGTEIEIDDAPATLDDIEVGDRVEVEFDADTDVASEITVRDDDGEDD
jgi:hypothetical protein